MISARKRQIYVTVAGYVMVVLAVMTFMLLAMVFILINRLAASAVDIKGFLLSMLAVAPILAVTPYLAGAGIASAAAFAGLTRSIKARLAAIIIIAAEAAYLFWYYTDLLG